MLKLWYTRLRTIYYLATLQQPRRWHLPDFVGVEAICARDEYWPTDFARERVVSQITNEPSSQLARKKALAVSSSAY